MKLVWSNLAREDLLALRRFSIDRWGRNVALRYLEDIRDAAKRLAIAPDRARTLKGPYRILRVRSHYLILHIDAAANRAIIARILHAAMDIDRHLP